MVDNPRDRREGAVQRTCPCKSPGAMNELEIAKPIDGLNATKPFEGNGA